VAYYEKAIDSDFNEYINFVYYFASGEINEA